MLEKEIEKYLYKQIKKIGGLCYKFISPGNSGVPDRIIILKKRIYFVELKRPGGKLSSLQKVQIMKIEQQGIKVNVIDSKESVENFIEGLEGD